MEEGTDKPKDEVVGKGDEGLTPAEVAAVIRMTTPDPTKEGQAHSPASELLDAVVQRLIDPVLRLLQNDPHQWSTRPCATCEAVSQIVGKPFGCVYFRLTGERRSI